MHKLKFALPLITLLFFSLLSWRCTKIDTTTIGNNLIPAVDNVTTFADTLSVIANNFDSVNKDCAISYPEDIQALGIISHDPYFGSTQATINAQFEPTYFPFYFPTSYSNMTLDSVVLVLSYKRLYGDSTVNQKVDVFELNSGFVSDSSSCSVYPHSNLLLGSVIYSPQHLKDSVKAFHDTSAGGELRIKLSNSYGQRLLSQDSTSNSALYSDSLFKRSFPGLAIVPNGSFGGNALSYFSLSDTATKLALYFRFKSNGVSDTVVYNFNANGLATSISNYITRNRAGSEIAQNTNHPVAGDNAIYIQTTPGTYAEIKIPGLTGYSNKIIHRAELIMDQVYSPSGLDTFFLPPNYLFLEVTDPADTSHRPIPCDFNNPSGAPNVGTFGGYRTFVTDPFGNPISRYIFNISRYVQKIVTNGRANSILRLSSPDYIRIPGTYVDECNQTISAMAYPLNLIGLGRVKLGGGNNTNYRMRVRIIYSKL